MQKSVSGKRRTQSFRVSTDNPGPRRIRRVAHESESGPDAVQCGSDEARVVTKPRRCGGIENDRPRTEKRRDAGVLGVSGAENQHVVAGPQRHESDEPEQFARAVADENRTRRNRPFVRKRVPQRRRLPVGIRVEPCSSDGGARNAGSWTERVDVGAEVDDPGRIDAEIATLGENLDRRARPTARLGSAAGSSDELLAPTALPGALRIPQARTPLRRRRP